MFLEEKLSQEQEDETNNEKAFSEELGRLVKDKRDSKKIRKTNASRNCKAVSDKIILKKTKDLEQSPKLPENNKEEINNESYFEDSNNMAASLNENSVIRMSNPQKVSLSQSEHLYEMDNDDKNVLNLNLSFIKKEEDG